MPLSFPKSHFLSLTAARPGLLRAPMLDAVREALGGAPGHMLSAGEAYGFALPASTDPETAMEAARTTLRGELIDVLVAPAGTLPCPLLLADMDSTIVTTETLDELAVLAGIGEEIAAITKRAMNGEIDFAGALRLRVGMLAGLKLGAVQQVLAQTRLTPGARELVQTMRAHGALTALVSGGFSVFTGPVAEMCGFERHFANTLLDDGAVLTGEVGEPILDRDSKLATLRAMAAELGVPARQALATGDGANDLPMLRAAGLGVAFHAKPIVAAEVVNNVHFGNLRALIFAQGFTAEEIRS